MIAGVLLAAALANCPPIAGAAPIVAKKSTQYLFVGEMHGTAETPALFADLVCAASLKRKVVVVIEQPPSEQSAIDAYLSSDGGIDARAAFLRSPIWTNDFKDGRSSQAMFAMIERLRVLRVVGRIAGIRNFQYWPTDARPDETSNNRSNRGMAEELERIAAANPGALVMVLTGSVHASKGTIAFGTNVITPAASLLPAARTISLYADGRDGTAWNCTDTCGAHSWRSATTGPRRVIVKPRKMMDVAKHGGLYDGTIFAGVPFTASPPALPATSPSAP